MSMTDATLTTDPNQRWLWRPRPREHARFRLFCFAHGGGGPRVFQGWDRWLDPDIELLAVRLPGRDLRMREAAYTEWPRLIEETAEALVPWLDRPFALFGHSFGAQLAFRLGARFCETPGSALRALGVSGCRPPHASCAHAGMAALDRDSFFANLVRWGGMPTEALAHPEFLRLFEPTLRADISLAESWYQLPAARVSVPLAAFAGGRDSIASPDLVQGWAVHTVGRFTFEELAGDHFFYRDHAGTLLRSLTSLLRAAELSWVQRGPALGNVSIRGIGS